MKMIGGLVRFFVILIVGIFIGVFLPRMLGKGNGAIIVLKNNSSKVIRSVEIETENGIRLVKDIEPSRGKKTKIFPSGESAYKMDITFGDNSTFSTDEVYVETGYRIVETIKDQGVETDYDLK